MDVNTNFKLALWAAVALSMALTGCVNGGIEKSHGTIANLHNGKPAKQIQIYDDEGSGKTKSGSTFRVFEFAFQKDCPDSSKDFYLDGNCQFALFYPPIARHHSLQAQTGSNGVYAWLVPTVPDLGDNFTYLGIPSCIEGMEVVTDFTHIPPMYNLDLEKEITSNGLPADLQIPGSIPLNGQVEIKQGSWIHRNYFYTKVDLASTNGLVLKCKYSSYDKLQFDPDSGVLWIGMLIWGDKFIF